MLKPDPSARRILEALGSSDRRTRVHARGRWRSCPFDLVELLVSEQGRILDLGCGFGHFSMYLALMAPARRVVGVDIDAAKIAKGVAAVADLGLGDRVELRAVERGWRPGPDEFDAIVLCDVLYLYGAEAAVELVDVVAAAVRPGGRVVVKEMAETPRWKHAFGVAQERLATGVLGLTAGLTVEMLTPAQIEEPLARHGLVVGYHPMDGGYLPAHLTITADRRG